MKSQNLGEVGLVAAGEAGEQDPPAGFVYNHEVGIRLKGCRPGHRSLAKIRVSCVAGEVVLPFPAVANAQQLSMIPVLEGDLRGVNSQLTVKATAGAIPWGEGQGWRRGHTCAELTDPLRAPRRPGELPTRQWLQIYAAERTKPSNRHAVGGIGAY